MGYRLFGSRPLWLTLPYHSLLGCNKMLGLYVMG